MARLILMRFAKCSGLGRVIKENVSPMTNEPRNKKDLLLRRGLSIHHELINFNNGLHPKKFFWHSPLDSARSKTKSISREG